MCVFLCVCVLCEYLCCLMKINKNETTTLFGALNVGQQHKYENTQRNECLTRCSSNCQFLPIYLNGVAKIYKK